MYHDVDGFPSYFTAYGQVIEKFDLEVDAPELLQTVPQGSSSVPPPAGTNLPLAAIRQGPAHDAGRCMLSGTWLTSRKYQTLAARPILGPVCSNVYRSDVLASTPVSTSNGIVRQPSRIMPYLPLAFTT